MVSCEGIMSALYIPHPSTDIATAQISDFDNDFGSGFVSVYKTAVRPEPQKHLR